MREVVILYVIDSLRADHLGCYHYGRNTSPCIDGLAEESVLFENIYSQSTETKSSSATIFTSTYPSVHGVTPRTPAFPDGLATMAESFKTAGYSTACFNTNLQIGARFRYSRGYDHCADLDAQPGDEQEIKPPPSDVINAGMIEWLERDPAEKAFIMAWSMDVHMPFEPPPAFRDKMMSERNVKGTVRDILEAETQEDFENLAALYDAGIRHNDHTIGSLVESLKKMRVWDSTAFVLCADHGEMIADHGMFVNHGIPPYEEVIHVPLIIRSPSLNPRRHKRLAGLIDLMPTMLSLARVEDRPTTMQGCDLFAESPPQHVFAECSYMSNGKKTIAVFDEQWKLLASEMTWRTWLARQVKDIWSWPKRMRRIYGEDEPPPEGKLPRRLARKFARQGRRIFHLGVLPCFCGGLLAWTAATLRHLLGRAHLELYDRKNDSREKRNVIAAHPARAREMRRMIETFELRNLEFKERLNLRREQAAADSKVAERLRQLGYL